jgi:hypothetical protein
MLRDKFREFGDVKFAEIRNKDTGLVRFSSVRDAQRAAGILFYPTVFLSQEKGKRHNFSYTFKKYNHKRK